MDKSEVKKKIFPGFDVLFSSSFEGEFRTRNDVGTIDRWSAGIDLSYSVNSYLKLGGAYNLINYNHPKREWEVGHRYSFYATGSYVLWNRIELSLREKIPANLSVGCLKPPLRQIPRRLCDHGCSLFYNLPKSKLTPYTSVEFYHTLNNPQGNDLEKTRYTLGTEYKINKRSKLDLFYRYQSETDDEER